ATLGAHVEPVARYATLGPATVWTVNGVRMSGEPSLTVPNPPRPSLAYSGDLAGHVRVVAGALPADQATAGDHPVSLPEDQPFGVKLGDRVCLGFVGGPGDPRRAGVFPLCLRVAAFWRALDPADPYWSGRFVGWELLASRADVFAGLQQMDRAFDITSTGATTGRLYRVPVGQLDAGDAEAVAGQLRALHGYYAVRTDAFFATDVDGAIEAFVARERLGSFTVQLVAAALALVALFAVSFVARHFLEAQATELAALRARGWRRRRVLAFLLLQLGILVAGALPLAAGLTAAAALALGRLAFPSPPALGTADYVRLAPPLAVAVAAVLVLLGALAAGAARRDVLELRRGASRPAGPAWWRWRAADLVLALVAVPLLAESRLRGGSAADSAGDPLGLLLPAVAIGLLAVAGLRLLPPIASVALRLVSGVPAQLARWELARRPAQHASLALLATFAVAVGVLSSIYATTDRGNALDRAAYRAGADARATYGPPEPRLDRLAASLPGAPATSQALRAQVSPGQVGGTNSTALAIDPRTFAGVAWSRPGLTGPPVADLTRQLARRDPDGLDLPGRPRTLSVWAWYGGDDGELTAEVTDAVGHAGTLDLGPARADGWRRLEAPVRVRDAEQPVYPVRLDRLVMRGPAHGNLALSDLAADSTVVEPFDRDDGWWALETGVIATGPAPLAPAAPGGRAARSIDVELPNGDLAIQPAMSSRPVPALVSPGLLSTLSIGLDQPFPLHFDSGPVTVTAVGTVDAFPTLYPDDRFIVLPLDPVLARLASAGAGPTVPNELWVRLGGSAAAGPVARRLSTVTALPPEELDVRADLQAAALADPLRTALDGTLALGFLATLAVAVLGFGIHFL
ncbi:MAG TPA: FtsX-like permease family protein, partial [Candidatus Dormibacteraeota bacterium]